MFSPIYPPLVSIPLTFLVVWLIHKSSAESKKLNTNQ
jgi:hypothetical protein